jgi:hypothetical protein
MSAEYFSTHHHNIYIYINMDVLWIGSRAPDDTTWQPVLFSLDNLLEKNFVSLNCACFPCTACKHGYASFDRLVSDKILQSDTYNYITDLLY